MDGLLKLSALLNFLMFLLRGRSASLTERVLRLDHVFQEKPAPRYIDYDYMGKELVWQHVGETIISIVPLINFRLLNRYALQVVRYVRGGGGGSGGGNVGGGGGVGGGDGGTVNDFLCQLCGERATNPYTTGSCRHVFCYYCLQVNVQTDSDFSCPTCGVGVGQMEPYQIVL